MYREVMSNWNSHTLLLGVQISKTTLQSSSAISGKGEGSHALKHRKHTSNMYTLLLLLSRFSHIQLCATP